MCIFRNKCEVGIGDESRPLEVGSLGYRKTQKDTTALGKVVSTMYTSFPHGTEVPFVIRGLIKIISLELKIVMENKKKYGCEPER